MAQMYGSAFIHVCIKNMHTTQTDRHIPGTYTYIYTDTLTPIGIYVHRTASHQLKFNLSEQPLLQSCFLPVLRQPLTWLCFIFCNPVGMHGRNLQVTSCTRAEVHQPRVLIPAGSRRWLSRGKGRSREIVSALHITYLQQPLVQGLLESDMGCMRLERDLSPMSQPSHCKFSASAILQQGFLQVSYGYDTLFWKCPMILPACDCIPRLRPMSS